MAFPKDTPSELREEARSCAAASSLSFPVAQKLLRNGLGRVFGWFLWRILSSAHPVGYWTAVVGSIPGLRAGAGLALCYDILFFTSLRADHIYSLFSDDPSDCLLARDLMSLREGFALSVSSWPLAEHLAQNKGSL